MIGFIFRRLCATVPLMLAVSVMVFLLMYLAPGDFLSQARSSKDISPEIVRQEEMRLGLDKPWYVQYARWLNGVSPIKTNLLLPENDRQKHGIVYFGQPDFGYSWSYKIPVSSLIFQRLIPTLILALASTLLSYAVAIPLGVIAAVKKDSLFDKISSFLAYAALSIPYFFLALLAVLFAAVTGVLPTGGQTSIMYEFMSPAAKLGDYLRHLILPTLVLSVGSIASIMRVMRGNFLDYSKLDFVTTARAKGLSENAIMFKHVLRNAMVPMVQYIPQSILLTVGGSLLMERFFSVPGMGPLLTDAIQRYDLNVVQTLVILYAVLGIVGVFLGDVLMMVVDPRITLTGKEEAR